MIDYQIYIGRRTPFPPATHGFLYYYNPYPLPEFMGHLRFRVTPNGDPSTFKQGHDLLLPSRVPWKFASLLGRRPSNITQIITEQLSLDGLIDDKVIGQMQQIRRHWEHVRLSLPSMDDVITGLGQEFIFNFTPNQYFWVMNFSEQGELQVGRTQIHIFSRQMHQGRPLPYDECYPYPGEFFSNVPYPQSHLTHKLGKAFTRFELAHPENPYLFVLRVTKILEPIVEIKRQPPGPREGELIKRISQKGKREDKAFVLDSRHATYSALGLLLHGTQQS